MIKTDLLICTQTHRERVIEGNVEKLIDTFNPLKSFIPCLAAHFNPTSLNCAV